MGNHCTTYPCGITLRPLPCHLGPWNPLGHGTLRLMPKTRPSPSCNRCILGRAPKEPSPVHIGNVPCMYGGPFPTPRRGLAPHPSLRRLRRDLRAASTVLITTLTKWLSHEVIKNINKHLSSLSQHDHPEPELGVDAGSSSVRRGPRDEALVCLTRDGGTR